MNELVVKFERIVGSGYYSIQPEIKGAHEVAAPIRFRGEPREADLPDGFAPSPAFPGSTQQPTSNNNALQQLLYQRPNLVRLLASQVPVLLPKPLSFVGSTRESMPVLRGA